MEAKQWIGIDIHKRQFTVCRIVTPGEQEIKKYSRDAAGFEEFKNVLDDKTVIGIESTCWTRHFAMQFKDSVKDILIFNTVDLKHLMSRIKKNDKNDAAAIAKVIQLYDKTDLCLSHLHNDASMETLILLRIRENLVSEITSLRNCLRSNVEGLGFELPKNFYYDPEKDRAFLRTIPVGEVMGQAMMRLYDTIDFCRNAVLELETLCKKANENNEYYHALKSEICGVGNITAAYLAAKIEDIGRFESPKKLSAYLGMVPRVVESDDKRVNCGITKRGNKTLMRLLVQSAWSAVNHHTKYEEYFHRLAARKPRQKAIIAVARKIIVEVFYTLKNLQARIAA
jgi:transposase